MTAQARFAARAGGGPCLQARGGGKAARGAPLLRLVAHKLGQHQRALEAHQRRRALLLLQQPAGPSSNRVSGFQRYLCNVICNVKKKTLPFAVAS